MKKPITFSLMRWLPLYFVCASLQPSPSSATPSFTYTLTPQKTICITEAQASYHAYLLEIQHL